MPVLLPQDVHIWSARRPPILPVDFEAVLSDGERTRAAGFFFSGIDSHTCLPTQF